MKCPEPCIRQEVLDEQISSLLQKVSMPQDWAEYFNGCLEDDRKESAQSVSVFVEKNQKLITDITVKLQRLLDGYLEQDIEKEIYRTEKAKLLSEKKSLEGEISRNGQKQKHWLEPPPPKQNPAPLGAGFGEFPCNPARKSLARPLGVPLGFSRKTDLY